MRWAKLSLRLAAEVLGANWEHFDRPAVDEMLVGQPGHVGFGTPPCEMLSGVTSGTGPAGRPSMQPMATSLMLVSSRRPCFSHSAIEHVGGGVRSASTLISTRQFHRGPGSSPEDGVAGSTLASRRVSFAMK
jgi:hypothetical protein